MKTYTHAEDAILKRKKLLLDQLNKKYLHSDDRYDIESELKLIEDDLQKARDKINPPPISVIIMRQLLKRKKELFEKLKDKYLHADDRKDMEDEYQAILDAIETEKISNKKKHQEYSDFLKKSLDKH